LSLLQEQKSNIKKIIGINILVIIKILHTTPAG
jgi:hypothetical protein